MAKFDLSKMTERDLCQFLPLVKHRLGEVGLLKTMHAMEAAVKAIGYEVCEHIEAIEHTAKRDEKFRADAWKRINEGELLHEKFDGNGRDRTKGGFCS